MSRPEIDFKAMRPLVVIVGQTAVGKTDLSLYLAEKFEGEIISADSRLFYAGFNIGTAKPAPEELARIPHHFVDVCRPDETLTLGVYQERAYETIDACHRRGTLPFLVGGTGQYVKAVIEGWGIPRVPPQPDLRAALEQMGGPECARWLRLLDPVAAERLDPRNVRRVIRALEVTLVAGRPISELQQKEKPPYHIYTIGLFRPREELYRRIDQRVDQMIAQGLEQEVLGLLESGCRWEMPAMSGLGYRQFRPYFEGDASLEEVVERIKFETHRFARQQNTWFRPDDPGIDRFDAADPALNLRIEEGLDLWLNRFSSEIG